MANRGCADYIDVGNRHDNYSINGVSDALKMR